MRRTRNATPGDYFQPFYSQLQVYFSDPLEANRRLKDHSLTATFRPFLHDKVAETHDLSELPSHMAYARAYRMTDDYCKSFVEKGEQVPDLTLILNHCVHLDSRR